MRGNSPKSLAVCLNHESHAGIDGVCIDRTLSGYLFLAARPHAVGEALGDEASALI
jgi:hypothetical protein